MTTQAETSLGAQERHLRGRLRDRVAAALLLVSMAVGSLGLWLGIPPGVLWALSKITASSAQHFLLALFGIPVAIMVWASALFRLNGLYLRVRSENRNEEADPDGERRRVRGPLEPLLITALAMAIIALLVWFLFFAQNEASHPTQPIPA